VIQDHFLTLVIFSVLVALFFATLNHRDRRGFFASLGKTLGWMVLGSLVLAFFMLWTGR
jgi:predicted membrane protein